MSDVIEDSEFGSVAVRRTGSSRSFRFSLSPTGKLRVSAPQFTPLFLVKRAIDKSRTDIRSLLSQRPTLRLSDGMPIGKRHVLTLRQGAGMSIRASGNQLILTLGPKDSTSDPYAIDLARAKIISILRKEAKEHLPNRLQYLADQHGFTFSRVRFSHASTRWGSCNSKGVISLNIALMNLSYELIDYVLAHELAHTIHMNHSVAFWSEVERVDPAYKSHKKQLATFGPEV